LCDHTAPARTTGRTRGRVPGDSVLRDCGIRRHRVRGLSGRTVETRAYAAGSPGGLRVDSRGGCVALGDAECALKAVADRTADARSGTGDVDVDPAAPRSESAGPPKQHRGFS